MHTVRQLAFAMLFVTAAAVFSVSLLGNGPVHVGFSSVYNRADNFLASIFFVPSSTELSLKRTYAEATSSVWSPRRHEKVKILIVPGHDQEYFGTQFNGVREVDLNLALASKLYDFLKNDPAFDVTLTQTTDGYNPIFANYFETNRDDIEKFIADHKAQMMQFETSGQIAKVTNVEHNYAPGEMGLKLFGINKWANDNGVDILIHVHFNDYPGRPYGTAGKYSGFTIYVPESQYSNAGGSQSVARAVHDQLAQFYAQSNMPKEQGGIVEDQDLIAVGADNSLDGASSLIEYGYIYQPELQNSNLREPVLSDLALQTYIGLTNFFGKKTDVGGKFNSTFLPHTWNADLTKGDPESLDVLSLQTALQLDGEYPPTGQTRNDCGLTGHFGRCTEISVKYFQEKYNIEPATGVVGAQTRAKLNELFGGN